MSDFELDVIRKRVEQLMDRARRPHLDERARREILIEADALWSRLAASRRRSKVEQAVR